MNQYEKIKNWWADKKIRVPEDIDKHLSNFRILFAYHSGRIENEEVTLHDTREIFENGRVLNFTGTPRTLFETENQKKCYEVLKYKIAAKEPLSISLVKEMHFLLTVGTYDERRYVENNERSGEFKKHDYITGRYEVGSAAENVESDLQELLQEVQEYKGNDFLKAAAYLHAVFESIHPFADGNGRVGRTLLNYYLLIKGHPPLIIYDRDKTLYYECLEKFDAEEKLEPLVNFLKYEIEQTWEKSLEIKERKRPKMDDFNLGF